MLRFIRIPLIILVLEAILYYAITPTDPELFFLVFIVISGFVLIYNIFNVASNASRMSGFGAGREGARISLSMMQIEKQFETKASKKRLGGGLFDPSNISLAFFVLVNVLIYWRIMPK